MELIKAVTPASLPEPGGDFDYTLTIWNTSPEPVTITQLTDWYADPFMLGSYLGTKLAASDGAVGGADTLVIPYTVFHGYENIWFADAFAYPNTASVWVEDNEGNPAIAEDTATCEVVDVKPTVTLDKSVEPASMDEPGGTFTYTVTVTNTGPEPVLIEEFYDSNPDIWQLPNLVGDLLMPNEPLVITYEVDYDEAGTYPNTATILVRDNEGWPARPPTMRASRFSTHSRR